MNNYPIQVVTEKCKLAKNGRSKVRSVKSIKYLMIHHSGSISLSLSDLIHLHTVSLHQWPTVGYHFYILQNGTIYQCNPITDVINGCLNHNSNTIHICFEGNYEVHGTTVDFNSVMHTIINFLPSVTRSSKIIKHREKKNTLCPGKHLCTEIDLFNDSRFEKTGLIWPEYEK